MPLVLNKKTFEEGLRVLAGRDSKLASILERYGPPPMWTRDPGFPTLLYIILEQQVSLASARAVYNRLMENMAPFTPERFQETGSSYLRSLGVTRQKAGYCINVAEAILEGVLDLTSISQMDDSDALDALTLIKGIGPWTANIYLLMALRRPDIWPSGDIALATSQIRKQLEADESAREQREAIHG